MVDIAYNWLWQDKITILLKCYCILHLTGLQLTCLLKYYNLTFVLMKCEMSQVIILYTITLRPHTTLAKTHETQYTPLPEN